VTPVNNIAYFNLEKPGRKYDVRLCTKNGCTTLKSAYILANFDIKKPPKGAEERIMMDYWWSSWHIRSGKLASSIEPPFRNRSIRIAVKRDPVDRFLSACSFLFKQKFIYKNKRAIEKFPAINDDLISIDTTVSDIIDLLKTRKIHDDAHFYSQSFFLGSIKDYDLIVDLKDLTKFLKKLEKEINPISSFKDIWYNNTSDINRYDNVTDNEVDQIKDLYKRDYKNGWY